MVRNELGYNDVSSYYRKRWNSFKIWWHAEETYCIHYGYYEKGTKSFIDAVNKMNDYIGELLNLKNKNIKVLDAGCGVGGTSFYLAKKYPNIKFIGLTNTQDQVDMGNKYIQKNNISNVEITLGDFKSTSFPDSSFDMVFAVESAGYSENVEDFINEMFRILKPGGKLLVLDGFKTRNNIDSITRKIYETYLYGQGYKNKDLPDFYKYIKSLEKIGFKEIIHDDISGNVARTQIRGMIIGIPFFISFLLKKILTFGIINSEKNYLEFSMGVSVLGPIIALKNVSRYYMTSAIKKG